MATKKRPEEYEAVLITHKACGGWWYWAVDMPGNRRDIKEALYTASTHGDGVQRLAPGTHSLGASCQCFTGGTR